MLALNAAIEAARVGEAGRGFAVVADAVKNLASQSRETASEAEKSIGDVKEAGSSVLHLAQQSSKESFDGEQVILEAIKGAEDLKNSIQNVAKIMDDLNAQVQQGMAAAKKVLKAVEEVSSIAQESASAAEEASAGVEEQSAAAEELTGISKKIASETQLAEERLTGIIDEIERLREFIINLA